MFAFAGAETVSVVYAVAVGIVEGELADHIRIFFQRFRVTGDLYAVHSIVIADIYQPVRSEIYAPAAVRGNARQNIMSAVVHDVFILRGRENLF